jgi:hypothetical protein
MFFNVCYKRSNRIPNSHLSGYIITFAVFVHFFCQPTLAQEASVESGLFTLEEPAVGQYVVSHYVGKPCPVMYPSSMAGDIIFKGDSIECNSGIQYDTTYDSIFKFNQQFPQINNADKKYLFDLIFKNHTITAPLDGYKVTAPYGKKLYFIRRPDSTYAAFVKIGEYIGGIDKAHYYLTSTTSKSPRLYKNTIQPYLNTLQFSTFSANALSGQLDPLFAFTEPSSVSQILEHIILSMYTNNDSTTSKVYKSRGFTFSSLQRRCDPVSSWAGAVTLSNGFLHFANEQGVNKVIEDTAQSLERLIISLGIKDDLKSQEPAGTVRFKDLFESSPIRSVPSGRQGSLNNQYLNAPVSMSTLLLYFADHKYIIPYNLTGSSQHTYLITSLTGRIIAAGAVDQLRKPQAIRVSKCSSGMMIVNIRNESDNVVMPVY